MGFGLTGILFCMLQSVINKIPGIAGVVITAKGFKSVNTELKRKRAVSDFEEIYKLLNEQLVSDAVILENLNAYRKKYHPSVGFGQTLQPEDKRL